MKNAESLSEFIQHHVAMVERELQEILPAHWHIPHKLRESIQYSLMAGGKRMRPILMFAAVESLGGSPKQALPVACAVEMIHTYSLVHDDLPAMDDDDYRRGKKSNHRVFGEALAILAGDALLTHAFHIIAQARLRSSLTAETLLTIVDELSLFAGPQGMVGGQAADIEGEQGITSIEQLESIHKHKTGDLIAFSLRAGGHVAGADREQLAALEKFGRDIGLAFQIQDDILDVIGDEQKLGKQVESDANAQKVTYPYLLGLETCKQKVQQLTEQGKDAIRQARLPNPSRLLEIAEYLMDRDH